MGILGQEMFLNLPKDMQLIISSSVQSLTRVQLFATPWTAAHQAFLSIINSQSLLTFMSIQSVMPSNHFIPLSSPSPSALNLSQHQGLSTSGGQSIGVSASASVLPMNIQDWFPLGWTTTATAAKSLQSCLTLCDPTDGSPPGSPVPGILQARTPEWAAISFSNACKWKVKVKMLSRIRPSATPWTAAFQAPPSIGFSRQEYWSGLDLIALQGTFKSLLQHHSSKASIF